MSELSKTTNEGIRAPYVSLAVWAAALPICIGLACVACSDGVRSILLQHTVAYAIFGVLAGFASYGLCGKRMLAAGRLGKPLERLAKAAIAFAVFAVTVAALRYIAEYERVMFVERLLSYRVGFIGLALVTLEGLLLALLSIAAPVFGMLWVWMGYLMFDRLGFEFLARPIVSRTSLLDLVSDALAFFVGALMWPAWYCVLPHLGAGFLVPIVLVGVFVLCVCRRALRQRSDWYARGMTMAGFGACLARVGAIATPQLLAPPFGLSLAALVVQALLIVAFALMASLPQEKPVEEAFEESPALLSDETEALLASYGLTEKESLAYVMKEQEASSAEIGEVLGVKAPTVREYQRRARAKLGDEGQRRVREQLRKEERAKEEAAQPPSPSENVLLGISVGLTLVVLALLPFGNRALLASYADRVIVSVAAGLLAAWFFLRARWAARLGCLSPQSKMAAQILTIIAVVGIAAWRLGKAGVLPDSFTLDVLGACSGVVAVFMTTLLTMDFLLGQGLFGALDMTGACLCVAAGFLFEEAWRVLGSRSFGPEAMALCMLMLASILWLLAQAGFPVAVLSTVSLLILVAAPISSGFEILHVAILLCMVLGFALVAVLLGNRFVAERVPEGDVRLDVWATPLSFDALLVLVLGAFVGLLLSRADEYLHYLDLILNRGEYFSTILASAVMLAVLGLGAMIIFGFAAFNAWIRIARLKASMDKDSEKKLRAGLVAEGLTERQSRVALLLAEGWTPDEISDKMAYSRATVVRDRGALYKMLAVRTRVGLAKHIEKLATELWGYEAA